MDKKQLVTTSMIGYESLAEEWDELEAQISVLKAQLKTLERRQEIIEQGFKDRLEDADIGVMNGWEALYKRTTQSRLNTKKLKAELPDLYEQYTEAKPFRRFELKRTAMPKPVESEFNF